MGIENEYSDCVVVVRLNSADEILGQYIRDTVDGEKVVLRNPYYVRYNMESMSMLPYCPLSDEEYFEIAKSKIDFLVLASSTIAHKFIKMIESLGEEESPSDDINYVYNDSEYIH